MVFNYLDKSLNFKDEGTGPVLVLLHGYPESLVIWDGFANELSKEFRVIRPDLPGLGDSEQIAEVQSMEMMAVVVRELLGYLNVYQCVMIGHSMGGYVTLAFAELYPELLKGFGLFHSMAMEDTDEGKKNRERTIALIRQSKNSFLNQFIPNLFAEHHREGFSDQIAELQKGGNKVDSQALVALMEGMKIRKDRLDVLANSKVPVLFILGKHDSRMPVERILPQTALPIRSHTLILGDAGHMGFYEEKEISMQTIAFFTRQCFLV
jgi:pimeloyl-ACP methyl ester carboxylesterase